MNDMATWADGSPKICEECGHHLTFKEGKYRDCPECGHDMYASPDDPVYRPC